MIKINYKEPESSETPEDIAQYNIKISDQYKKADYLEISCISWLKIDSSRNYQDLEQMLRNLKTNSYIIAQPITTIPTGLEINYPNENISTEKLEYVAKVSSKPYDDSLKELLEFHSSYEENFKCLKKTGCLMAVKQDKLDKKEEEIITRTQGVEEIKKVLECRLKLDFSFYKPMESINFIINDLTNRHGTRPEKIACGEVNGNKVWALILGGEIVSPIGWIEKFISEEKKNTKRETESDLDLDIVTHGTQIESIESIEYELIDFRNVKMERS